MLSSNRNEDFEKRNIPLSELQDKVKELTDTNTMINIDDDSLIKLFIGNNYNKIVSLKFSFPTFFFGPLYLLYRKQYLVSLAWTILIILLIVIMFRFQRKHKRLDVRG